MCLCVLGLGLAAGEYWRFTGNFFCQLFVQQIREDSKSQVTAPLMYCHFSLLRQCH